MEINFGELTVGMVIERNIIRKDGTLILNKGTKLTSGLLARLRNLEGTIKFEGDEPQVFEEVDEEVDESLRKETE